MKVTIRDNRRRWLAHLMSVITSLWAVQSASAHTALFLIVDTVVIPERLKLAPGAEPILQGELTMNFAPGGIYAGLFITDLPGYDVTLFPFGDWPGAVINVERVSFPEGFGMFDALGNTTPVFEEDGDMVAFTGHRHFVHHADVPGIHKMAFRYVDSSGQLVTSRVMTVTFRAYTGTTDTDGDGDRDQFDNCPLEPNADQADMDGDSVGDACDCCPFIANRDQLDLNRDGLCDACNCDGDACEPADVNYDGSVDLRDLIYSRNSESPNFFPPAPPETLRCDVDVNGQIDVDDLVLIRADLP